MVQVPVSQFQSVFINSKTPSHVSKLTHKFFEYERFTGEKVMELLDCLGRGQMGIGHLQIASKYLQTFSSVGSVDKPIRED